MSELVEDSFFLNFQSNLNASPKQPSSRDQILNGLIHLIERAHVEGFNIKINQPSVLSPSQKLKTITHLKYSEFILDLVVEVFLDLKKNKLQFQTSFLDQDQYFCIHSSAKRKIFYRKLLKINNQIELDGFKFIQDMQNGKIILFAVFEQSHHIFDSKETIWDKIKANLRKICQICKNYQIQIIQFSDKERYKRYFFKKAGEQYKKIKKQETSYAKLVKQLKMSHISFGFSSKIDETSFPMIQKSRDQEFKLQQFMMNASSDNFEPNSRKLYLCSFTDFFEVSLHEITYEIQPMQAKTYGTYLKNPIPKDPNPGENKFIFNYIEIVKPESVIFRETGLEGGMNKILIAKTSFSYSDTLAFQKVMAFQTGIGKSSNFNYNSKANEEIKRQNNPTLTKMVALKVPKKNYAQKLDEKYENEKNIIRLFKNGVSAYILKYYISGQRNFQYKNALLIDFLPNSQPLSNFIQIFKETLSLHSKSYLIVNMVNSLRFLNDYQVVHMDLNLNNFLVLKDYLTKLIDFGEAYNHHFQKITGPKFKRGYTFPFCPPEYFERKQDFSSKQDIFSLGMIIWRLVFNDYPFFPSNQSIQTFKDKTYMNKILLAPERGEAYGNIQTIDFVYQVILKCLSPNQALRCEASWLTIFFKIIYFYLL